MLQPPGSGSHRRAPTSRRKTQEENPDTVIRQLQRLPPNKKCADCSSKLPSCVNLTVGTFVCMTCAGVHRELNAKVKSVGHSSFSAQEVEQLKSTDNDKVNALYMARYNPSTERIRRPRDNRDPQLLRTWIHRKYQDRAWYSGEPSRPDPQATVVQIPPAAAPTVDLFGGDAFAPAPAPPPQQQQQGGWDAFGGSTQTQQAPPPQQPTNGGWDAFGGSSNNNANTNQQQQQSTFQANFGNFGAAPAPASFQAPASPPHQKQQFNNFASFPSPPQQQQQQQQPNGFASFPSPPQLSQTNPQQSQQQGMMMPPPAQPTQGMMQPQGVAQLPQQQQFQQPIQQQQMPNQQGTMPQTSMTQGMMMPPQQQQGMMQQQPPQTSGGMMAQQQFSPQSPQQGMMQQQPPQQQQGMMQQQPPQQQQGMMHQQPPQQQQGMMQQQPPQQQQGIMQQQPPQQSGMSLPMPQTHTTVSVASAADAISAINVSELDSTAQSNKEKTSEHPSKYSSGQKVFYKSASYVGMATIVKVHLDDDLEPFYTISVDGKEKQTDDAHLSSKHPLQTEIEEALTSLSSEQLQQVKTFISNLPKTSPAATPQEASPSLPPQPSSIASTSTSSAAPPAVVQVPSPAPSAPSTVASAQPSPTIQSNSTAPPVPALSAAVQMQPPPPEQGSSSASTNQPSLGVPPAQTGMNAPTGMGMAPTASGGFMGIPSPPAKDPGAVQSNPGLPTPPLAQGQQPNPQIQFSQQPKQQMMQPGGNQIQQPPQPQQQMMQPPGQPLPQQQQQQQQQQTMQPAAQPQQQMMMPQQQQQSMPPPAQQQMMMPPPSQQQTRMPPSQQQQQTMPPPAQQQMMQAPPQQQMPQQMMHPPGNQMQFQQNMQQQAPGGQPAPHQQAAGGQAPLSPKGNPFDFY